MDRHSRYVLTSTGILAVTNRSIVIASPFGLVFDPQKVLRPSLHVARLDCCKVAEVGTPPSRTLPSF